MYECDALIYPHMHMHTYIRTYIHSDVWTRLSSNVHVTSIPGCPYIATLALNGHCMVKLPMLCGMLIGVTH